jgi:outer membrane biosynthesis protein TonB
MRCFAFPEDDFEPVQSHQSGYCLTSRHRMCARYAQATRPELAAATTAATPPPPPPAPPAPSAAPIDDRSRVRPLDDDGSSSVRVIGRPETTGGRTAGAAAGAAFGGRALGSVWETERSTAGPNWFLLAGIAFGGGVILALLIFIGGRFLTGGFAASPTPTPTPTVIATPAPAVIPPTPTPQATPTPAPSLTPAGSPTPQPKAATPTPAAKVSTPTPAAKVSTPTPAPKVSTPTPQAKASPTPDTAACNLDITVTFNPAAPQANQPYTVNVTSRRALNNVAINGQAVGSGTQFSITETRPAGTYTYAVTAGGQPCGGSAVTVR